MHIDLVQNVELLFETSSTSHVELEPDPRQCAQRNRTNNNTTKNVTKTMENAMSVPWAGPVRRLHIFQWIFWNLWW